MKNIKIFALSSVLCFVLFTTIYAKAASSDIPIMDSDNDGYSDATELQFGYDPFSASTALLPKTIRVSLKNQRLSYFTGQYKVAEIKVSTGVRGRETPKGEFFVLEKKPVARYKGEGYDYPNTKWNLLFSRGRLGGYYIHGAYWHNSFGRPKSHGCVNVSYKDMPALYAWAATSTKIIIE